MKPKVFKHEGRWFVSFACGYDWPVMPSFVLWSSAVEYAIHGFIKLETERLIA